MYVSSYPVRKEKLWIAGYDLPNLEVRTIVVRSGGELEISKDGHRIVAFFGSTDGGYISSLGACLMK